ncbi:acyltransferase [Dyella solisilvae]|uniref:Acyltransferase n=1 Tax=Dyella solisilvae TaxID=1920168 RepID=A0A370KCE3_9GAMM|nr:acyltransferase [Dyella solisilvae]RDJ00270.1 acyltransferase [Dyella solisilvae]
MNRLPGLDLLRAIAIAWVMIFHSYIIGGWGHFAGLDKHGWMGVDLFFALSGFLIGQQVFKPLAAGGRFSFADFYLRRAFRILPVYLLVVAVYFLWPGGREYPGIQPLWQFLTFSVNLLIDAQNSKAFSHVWSLCVEEHFYLLFPLLALWLARRPTAAKFLAVCIGLVLFGMLVRGYVWLHLVGPAIAADDQQAVGSWFLKGIYYPTWARLDGLLAGVVLAGVRVYRPDLWGRWSRYANLAGAAGLAVVALSIWLFRDRVDFIPTLLGYPLLSLGMGLLVLCGASQGSVSARVRLPGAAWLAAASYSLYLSHKLVFHGVESAFGSWLDGHGLLTFTGYAAATLAVGAVLHYGIELPFLRLRGRLLSRSPGEMLPPVAQPVSSQGVA